MPHINRIRVNNVKYNFGTQYYDDFLMRFSGKNTIYDLANGGGKSVLMLLLLQNMIPNCTLDDKQPIEKLFRTNEGSTTIHSLIEWELSDAHIRDNFRYMLTGFCARKARDSGFMEEELNRNSAAIEYYNYCIFYRKYNDNDIKNLPLEKDGEKITYTGLKNYLKELERGNYNLEVHVFERKGDYQKFIAEYGIYESEWEIIRGINKTEGHVRTYFETHYKTTRKVVEDLLIEEIIEKSFRNKYAAVGERQSGLAETLLNIKDKLLELSEKREEIQNYDRQIGIMEGFVERLQLIQQMYQGIDRDFRQIQRLYNTLQTQENKNRQQKEAAAEARLQCMKEKNEFAMKVDTAKVLADMEEQQKLTALLEQETVILTEMKQDILKMQEELRKMECGNYYLEYQDYKKEYDILKQVIVNLQADHGGLEEELQELLSWRRYYDGLRKDELHKEMVKQRELSKAAASRLLALEESRQELDHELAVLRYNHKGLSEQEVKLQMELQKKRKGINILLLESIPKELGQLQGTIQTLEQQQRERTEELLRCRNTYLEKQIRLEGIVKELEENQAALQAARELQSKWLSDKEKQNTLMEVYGETDRERLLQKILEQEKASLIAGENLRTEIAKKKERLKALEEGHWTVENHDQMKVLQYIYKFHGAAAVSGQKYLENLEAAEARRLLEKLPILPYAIVVQEAFEEIKYDNRLQELLEEDGCILLFDEKALQQEQPVLYLVGEKAELGKEKQELRKDKLRREIEELQRNYQRRQENEEVLQEDYIFLLTLQKSSALDEEALEQRQRELKEQQKLWKEELEYLLQQQRNLEKQLEQGIEQIQKNQKEAGSYTELIELQKQTEAVIKEREAVEHSLHQKEQEYEQAGKRLEEEHLLQNDYQQKLTGLQRELQALEEKWQQTYSIYYKDLGKTVLPEDVSLSAEQVSVKLDAILEGMNQDHASAADKEKLLQAYGQSMEKALERIRYLGETPESFAVLWERKSLLRQSSETLTKKKDDIRQAEQKKDEKQVTVGELNSKRDQLQGKITHGVSLISKKYGYFDAALVDKQEMSVFLNENEALLASIEKKMAVQNQQLKELEAEGIELQVLKKETQTLMTRGGIREDVSVGCLEMDTELKAQWKRLAGSFDSFIDERYRRTREFQEELAMLVETLDKLNVQALAQEIKTHIHMPESEEEVKEMLHSFEETISLIHLEKERVFQGLEDMQMIKENFENQCIQTCVNIRTELERLDKLSKITMEDETIGMIQLKIPYVKEEQYQSRMTEYIDEIARATDSFEKEEDKLKYLRNNLCWKRLFSVIVSDMNGIRMNLYKRERISGQSRYLPYEEAVGSTGQSQGIYIQFLVSIINYISSIHAKKTDAGRLKKTIFIDNPFGAAKDVYIWEPIFKLLKTNNVQLIVPARGVTPAITGRFDVNYILGQKLLDGRQQTVVVDYYSNVAGEELEYTTFDYQQTSLF